MSNSQKETNKVDDDTPLWKYVTNCGKLKSKEGQVVGKGGSVMVVCDFCDKTFQGTYTRVRSHLLGIKGKGIGKCPNVTQEKLNEMKKLEDEVERRKEKEAPYHVPLPTQINYSSEDCQSTQFKESKKRKENPICKLYDVPARNHLDAEIARMFFTGGLPFNFARNPHYLNAFQFAANNNLSGYIPPGYNKLRTTLLQQERDNVEKLLVPIKATWKEKGVTIVSDGWSDPQRRPLINFMATSANGPIFIKTVNCFGEVKDKNFIADLMKEVIDEVGHMNVVQVITDNAANCKGAGKIIEGMYPWIYWTPCVVHTLNLALKNICAAKNVESNQETFDECQWIAVVHGDAIQVKNFIMNHTMRLAIFNRFSSLKLLAVADTRFASVVVMLKRFKLLRRSLETMVMSDEWASYKEDDQGKAKFVKETVVSDSWWEKVEYILNFTGPIYDMIRACDTDKPTLHLVYEMWDTMIEKVKLAIYTHEGLADDDYPSDFYRVVYDILVARWAKNNTPLHCLANSLNPRFYSDSWLQKDEKRTAPHRDTEISTGRISCFKRLFPDIDDFNAIMNEYGMFSYKSGVYKGGESLHCRDTIDPMLWWVNFGSSTPYLQALALRVLGQPSSSSCCERNWSTYSFIHSLRRNRLNPKRAEDLVYIHNNLRLLSRNTDEYTDEKTRMWDVGGDQFDIMQDGGDGGGFLQFAELSLDEPELESMFFSDGTS